MWEDGGPATVLDANIWGKDRVDKLVANLKKLGHDSVAVADEHGKLEDTTYIVFDRKTLKSVKE